MLLFAGMIRRRWLFMMVSLRLLIVRGIVLMIRASLLLLVRDLRDWLSLDLCYGLLVVAVALLG